MPPKKTVKQKQENVEQIKQIIDSKKESRVSVLLLDGFRYQYKSKTQLKKYSDILFIRSHRKVRKHIKVGLQV